MPLPRGPLLPMLAVPADAPFDDDGWLFEVKWDGTRVLAFCDDRLKLQNRRLRDIAYRYPEIRPQVRGPALLDGEIVVMEGGRPDFPLLQERERAGDAFKARLLARQHPATYVVFDVLHWQDRSLLKLPLLERRRVLEKILEPGDGVSLSEPVRGRGVAYFEAAKARGLEGILAKRTDSPYLPGKRVDFWKKIKTYDALDCVVCGLTTGTGWREPLFGALILGAYRDRELRFLGKVGTGFDAAKLEEIQEFALPLRGVCPFPREPEVEPGVKAWLNPRLVCEIKYLEFTEDGKLRAPVFLRLRPDLEPEECVLPASHPRN